jgi:hypothetical protein
MERPGEPVDEVPELAEVSRAITTVDGDLPTSELLKIALHSFAETGSATRSAQDAAIYRAVAPSVVLIVTKSGLGSGSLVGSSGQIATNWHVVRGAGSVAVVFKPAIEGAKPNRDEIVMGHVTKYDEVTDLALVQTVPPPPGRAPIRLGDASEISVGVDVHAIGHPTGENWSYTKGIISQYRMGYEWKAEGVTHKADVIQTQTPINPGNSGGPLISESGTLIGINSFKVEGEGLNFAISVEELRRFLVKGDRLSARSPPRESQAATCQSKEVFRSRNKEGNSVIVGYDTNCGGKANAELVIPDKHSDPIVLQVDRNGDGLADVIFFDFKRKGQWELSFWDDDFAGKWTLVGHHSDGTLTPTSFESYETFQSSLAKR